MWFLFDILHHANFFLITGMVLIAIFFNHVLGRDTKFAPFLLILIPLFLCLLQISAYIYISKAASFRDMHLFHNDVSVAFLVYFSSFYSNAVISLFLLGTLRYLIILFDFREGIERLLFWIALFYIIGVFGGNMVFLWNKAMANPLMLANWGSWGILPLDSLIFFIPGAYAAVRLAVERKNGDNSGRRKYYRAAAAAFLPIPLFALFDIFGIDRGLIITSIVPFRTTFIPFTIFIVWGIYHLMQDKIEQTRPIIDEYDQKKALKNEYGVSEREIEIIEQVAQGNPNKVIGEALFISENTVKSHIKNIYRKLEISNRIQLLKLLEKLRGHR
jgi:DNA-binding CsgD family transcriptional regulator